MLYDAWQEVHLSKGEAAELAGGEPISQCAPKLHRAIGLTCESTVKHLKSRFSSLLGEFYLIWHYILNIMTCLKRMLRDLTCSVCPLLIEENAKDVATAKAVRCFNIFNHDSWPEDRLGLLDHGVEELNFLLQHFSTVLDR